MIDADKLAAATRDIANGRKGSGAARNDGATEADRQALYTFVKEQLAGPDLHSEEIQYELGCWMHMLETTTKQIKAANPSAVIERLVREAGAAIPALLSDKPELVFARTLRMRADIDLLRHNGWLTRFLLWMTGGSPVQTVCVGALAATLFGLMATLLWLQNIPILKSIVPFDAQLVVAAAFLGGLVSIMTRLQSFARLTDFEHVFQFVNAFARPFLGAAFGVFAFAALKSGFIPLDKEFVTSLSPYNAWAIGFAAGFSERIGPALITRAEGLLSSSKK
jgi:hypothetical protein